MALDSAYYPDGSFGPVKTRYISTATGKVLVIPGLPRQLRVRATTAQVNAGLIVLPSIPGFGYRIVDATFIAIGGAASGATDVRLLGTRSGSSVALGVAAVAGLTQSTVLRLGTPFATAGTASIVALADGASHTVLDANTAVTVGKTGGSLATSTAIDFLITYVVE
jgi:hypothetical protein